MDDTGDVTQDRQEDVDEEICAAATLKEDSERWEEDGEDDLDDIAVVEHVSLWCSSQERPCSDDIRNMNAMRAPSRNGFLLTFR